MKKILITLLLIIICTGCINTKKIEVEKKDLTPKDKPTYTDLNTTPISFYSLQGDKLTKLTMINRSLNPLEDVGLFQIYPSNEEEIHLTDLFGTSFHNTWENYNKNNNLKIGFNITFKTTSDETISYNILSPANTFDKWEYLMNYLYDDYTNQNKNFYSHIENNEYTDDTLFTAFKMQSNSKCNEIKDKIELTVFTYDTEDDLTDNNYRGNSKSTLIICLNGSC